MSARDNQRIVILQRALKLAKDALQKIEHGARDPEGIASDASYEIMRVETQARPTPLEPPLGRERRR